MSVHDDYEPHHQSSPTEQLIQDLLLHGYRPSEDELDQRPLPEDRIIEGAVADIFDALVATITDTSLDFDLPDLLWSTVNIFHRAVDRIEQKLDDNEQAQKRLQREQDGSEVKSLQLERLIDIGMNLIDRRDGMEARSEAGRFNRDADTNHQKGCKSRRILPLSGDGRARPRWSAQSLPETDHRSCDRRSYAG